MNDAAQFPDIPRSLLPRDGRFGSGPSLVRAEQVEAITAAATSLLGTSHREAPVRALVHRVRTGLTELFSLPDGYEVVLGNGGSTTFWDIATACLVRRRAQHCAFGEFGSKFAHATSSAGFLERSSVRRAPAGSVVLPEREDGVDVYAWPHNETSTGAMVPVETVAGAGDALMVVDGTSAAGGLPINVAETDVYYFAPQKVFGSDGGLWIALCSPAAIDRAMSIAEGTEARSGRWIPDSLSLSAAIANSRKDQTLNTPAIATLIMLAEQIEWIMSNGGLQWSVGRSATSAARLYAWAGDRDWATPFVGAAEHRSTVVGTIDLDESIDAQQVIAVLRRGGVVDVAPYRKLGRNQLRVGMFPAVDPDDVVALTQCVDWIVDRL